MVVAAGPLAVSAGRSVGGRLRSAEAGAPGLDINSL